MSSLPPKTSLKTELERALLADLAVRERAYRAAREGATHEEAKPENDKDTRALEQSYLARGEAQRLEELRSAIAELQAMTLRAEGTAEHVAMSALVVVEERGEKAAFFIAPCGGGARLADGAVQVVTPKSPLGRALLGACVGDECHVELAGRKRVLSVVGIV